MKGACVLSFCRCFFLILEQIYENYINFWYKKQMSNRSKLKEREINLDQNETWRASSSFLFFSYFLPYFLVFFLFSWQQLADRPRSVPPHSLFLTDDCFVVVAVIIRMSRHSMCLEVSCLWSTGRRKCWVLLGQAWRNKNKNIEF